MYISIYIRRRKSIRRLNGCAVGSELLLPQFRKGWFCAVLGVLRKESGSVRSHKCFCPLFLHLTV